MRDDVARILVADDETAIADGLTAILQDDGYDVRAVGDGRAALDALSEESFGVVLADLNMPELDGIALLGELQARDISTECIIITGRGTVESAVKAMRIGAYDYVEKPLNAEKLTRLRALIEKALQKYEVKQSNRELSKQLAGMLHYGEIVGQSEVMHAVYAVIEKVAPSNASVLIQGESGTGKELVARALHTNSERAKGPFLALNCAALPKDILENELFGHEKGAFTGSTNEKPGAFEMAHGGTLFLDEVAEIPPEIQVKLLRALESRSIRRLGGKKEISVDIRIVAATNKDVHRAMSAGELRDDLYYRLAVVEMELPPLRARVGDIKLLASEFLTRFSESNSKKITGFEDDAIEWITSYGWPGNVRELKNAVERAVVMSRGPRITREDIIPLHMRETTSGSVSIEIGTTLVAARRTLVLRTLSAAGGDKERAAEILGVEVSEVDSELRTLLNGSQAAVDGVADRAAAGIASDESEETEKAAQPVVATGGRSKKQKPGGRK